MPAHSVTQQKSQFGVLAIMCCIDQQHESQQSVLTQQTLLRGRQTTLFLTGFSTLSIQFILMIINTPEIATKKLMPSTHVSSAVRILQICHKNTLQLFWCKTITHIKQEVLCSSVNHSCSTFTAKNKTL